MDKRNREDRVCRLLSGLSIIAAGAAGMYGYRLLSAIEVLVMAFIAALGVILMMGFLTSWLLFGDKNKDTSDELDA